MSLEKFERPSLKDKIRRLGKLSLKEKLAEDKKLDKVINQKVVEKIKKIK